MLNARKLVQTHNVALITLDTLRYDIAQEELCAGQTPNLAALLPGNQWEERHSPGSFTYAAHQAFFAGFLPTPACPGRHARLFAAAFAGSETTTSETCVLDAPDIITGLREQHGFYTICIGGVGFFNQKTALGSVLPGLFDEAHWNETLGVTDANSTAHQFHLASERLKAIPQGRQVMLFINISALHQPNRFYLPGATEDSKDTHAAALRYVDSQFPILLSALYQRGPWIVILCSDHGTAYWEDGYHGHRLAHPTVWTVPYAEFILETTP
jgi:hypothetical protein